MTDVLIFAGVCVGGVILLGYGLKGLEGLESWVRKVLKKPYKGSP